MWVFGISEVCDFGSFAGVLDWFGIIDFAGGCLFRLLIWVTGVVLPWLSIGFCCLGFCGCCFGCLVLVVIYGLIFTWGAESGVWICGSGLVVL